MCSLAVHHGMSSCLALRAHRSLHSITVFCFDMTWPRIRLDERFQQCQNNDDEFAEADGSGEYENNDDEFAEAGEYENNDDDQQVQSDDDEFAEAGESENEHDPDDIEECCPDCGYWHEPNQYDDDEQVQSDDEQVQNDDEQVQNDDEQTEFFNFSQFEHNRVLWRAQLCPTCAEWYDAEVAEGCILEPTPCAEWRDWMQTQNDDEQVENDGEEVQNDDEQVQNDGDQVENDDEKVQNDSDEKVHDDDEKVQNDSDEEVKNDDEEVQPPWRKKPKTIPKQPPGPPPQHIMDKFHGIAL